MARARRLHLRVADAKLDDGPEGFLILPPGGEIITLDGCSQGAEILIAVGMPHRKPYFKYVGYGGGFVHSSEDRVIAEMSKYEQSPREYGRQAIMESDHAPKLVSAEILTSHLDLIGGFQSDEGDMMERPKGVSKCRFKYNENSRGAPVGTRRNKRKYDE